MVITIFYIFKKLDERLNKLIETQKILKKNKNWTCRDESCNIWDKNALYGINAYYQLQNKSLVKSKTS